jgi:hypothetical protein
MTGGNATFFGDGSDSGGPFGGGAFPGSARDPGALFDRLANGKSFLTRGDVPVWLQARFDQMVREKNTGNGQLTREQFVSAWQQPRRGGGRGPSGGGGFPGVGRGAPGGATTSRSIAYRNIGTIVQVTPQIGADGLIELELRVEVSRTRTAEDVTLATDATGTNVPATTFVTSSVESRLKVRPGHVALARGTATSSKSGLAQTVVLISAMEADK